MGEWKESKIKELSYVIMGQSPDGKTVNENENGIAFLQGNADFGNKYPTEKYWCEQPKKLALPDDMLLSVRAPVGEINIAHKTFCIGRGLSAIRFLEIDTTFGIYKFSTMINQLLKKSQGTTFLAINKSDIDNLIIFTSVQNKQAVIVRTQVGLL
jgi:type I restriction enzyme S subunit